MKTAVVILNWNTKDYLRKFLPGLIQSLEGLDAEVIVADSGSADGSPDMMEEEFPEVRLIRLNGNYGFTGGYNRALARVEAEYYVLINSDIEVTPGWLSPLVEWMDSNPRCGVCGPKLLSWKERDCFEYAGAAGGLIDRWGYPFCRGRLPGKVEKDSGRYDSPADLFWISGACLMTRSDLWKRLGGLDDRFFAHMEEIDYCWRCQLEGYTVRSIPSSKVYHIGGGTLPAESPWKLELNYRNNLLMLENNLAKTFVCDGMSVRRAFRAARGRIFTRKVLDGCSAAVYLLTFKGKAFASVLRAHRAYRDLNRRLTLSELSSWKENHVPHRVRGRYEGSIIFAAALHRKIDFDL